MGMKLTQEIARQLSNPLAAFLMPTEENLSGQINEMLGKYIVCLVPSF